MVHFTDSQHRASFYWLEMNGWLPKSILIMAMISQLQKIFLKIVSNKESIHSQKNTFKLICHFVESKYKCKGLFSCWKISFQFSYNNSWINEFLCCWVTTFHFKIAYIVLCQNSTARYALPTPNWCYQPETSKMTNAFASTGKTFVVSTLLLKSRYRFRWCIRHKWLITPESVSNWVKVVVKLRRTSLSLLYRMYTIQNSNAKIIISK